MSVRRTLALACSVHVSLCCTRGFPRPCSAVRGSTAPRSTCRVPYRAAAICISGRLLPRITSWASGWVEGSGADLAGRGGLRGVAGRRLVGRRVRVCVRAYVCACVRGRMSRSQPACVQPRYHSGHPVRYLPPEIVVARLQRDAKCDELKQPAAELMWSKLDIYSLGKLRMRRMVHPVYSSFHMYGRHLQLQPSRLEAPTLLLTCGARSDSCVETVSRWPRPIRGGGYQCGAPRS